MFEQKTNSKLDPHANCFKDGYFVMNKNVCDQP